MPVKIINNFDAKNLTTFKISGLVKNAYFPENINELTELLRNLDNPIVLGNCSNVLISSEGYDGDVIFTRNCKEIKLNGSKIYAECGVKGQMASKFAFDNGLSGFEFMIGFPGTIGGEIYMNASANNQSISDYLECATVFDNENKNTLKLSKKELNFSYRNSICQTNDYKVLSAEFNLVNIDKRLIKEKMNSNLEFRKKHQPSLVLPNCGSVFKNPENSSAGMLIDSVDGKKLSVGGAKIWENHANFIINFNNATSKDILNLMLLVYNKVKNRHGIKLKPELVYIGNKSQNEEEIWKILQEK